MARCEQGFTAKDLLWTLVVLALLAGGLYLMSSGQTASYQRELHDERSRRALEGALSFISRELRHAGSGFGACRGAVRRWSGKGTKTHPTHVVALEVYNDCNLLSSAPRRCPDGSGVDSLSVAYVEDFTVGSLRSAALVAAMPSSAPSSPLLLRSAGHFRQGDRMLLSAPGRDYCTLLRLTAKPTPLGAYVELPHDPDGHFNPPAERNIFPPGGYPRGALVTRVSSAIKVRYLAIDNRRPYPSLVTWTRGGTRATEIVAEGIEDMQLAWACDANGDGRYTETSESPATDEWAHTRAGDRLPRCGAAPPGKVRVTLIARPRIADPRFERGKRPAAEDRPAGDSTEEARLSNGRGTFRRRKVSALITLINVVGERL